MERLEIDCIFGHHIQRGKCVLLVSEGGDSEIKLSFKDFRTLAIPSPNQQVAQLRLVLLSPQMLDLIDRTRISENYTEIL